MTRTDHDQGELGRRDFLRSATLLGAGMTAVLGGCSDSEGHTTGPSNEIVPGRKWIRIDSTDPETGTFVSVDGFSDSIDSAFSGDVEWNGHTVLASGEIIPLTVSVEKECANSLSLASVGGGVYQVRSDGVPQPPGAPYEIRIVERTIPGTEVLLFTGFSLDPSTGKRVLFNITHDPIPWWVIIALAALIVATTAQPAGGSGCIQQGGAKSRRISISKSSSNLSLADSSGALTATCTTKCNHDQGGGS